MLFTTCECRLDFWHTSSLKCPNSARVQYILATELYGLPLAYNTLLESIKTCRHCLAIEPNSSDAAYNLAQSLHILGSYISDDTMVNSPLSGISAASVWWEARMLLQQVEDAQMALLRRDKIPSFTSSPLSEKSTASLGIVELDADNAMEAETAIEEHTTTPSVVIETILTAVEICVSLLSVSDQSSIRDDINALLQRAASLDSRHKYMQKEIQSTRHDALQAILGQQSGSGTFDNPELDAIIREQRESIQSSRRTDPAGLSELADSLVLHAKLLFAILSTTDALNFPRANNESLLEAIALFEQARRILQNPLQRPASLPSHHIPSVLVSNLCSASEVLLLLAISNSGLDNAGQPNALNYLWSAKRLALEALDKTGGPFKQAAGSELHCPSFMKTPRSLTRDDYRTVIATREAVLCVTRSQLFGPLLFDGEVFSEQTRVSLLALLNGVWPNPIDRKNVVEGWLEEARSSAIGHLAILLAGRTEEAIWREVLQ